MDLDEVLDGDVGQTIAVRQVNLEAVAQLLVLGFFQLFMEQLFRFGADLDVVAQFPAVRRGAGPEPIQRILHDMQDIHMSM
jgi:hypothetical protein